MEKPNMSNELSAFQEAIGSSKDRFSQVKIIAEYVLGVELKATDSDSSKSAREIINSYKVLLEKYPQELPEIPDTTFTVFLSKISNEQSARVNCLGRKQGYFIDRLVKEIEDVSSGTSKNSEKDEKQDIVLEKNIYPFIKTWLFEKNHDRVADISTLKKNGKWGNPDLIGINIEEIYGRPEIEIATVEVKITDEGWEHWIFEAVAHTRFSNRSYFAFVYPENLINKLDSTSLKLYAEHFGIGILVISVSNDTYLKIKKREYADLNDGNVSIVEYRHAPFNATHIKFRKKFFESLDILELNKLYSFGEKLE